MAVCACGYGPPVSADTGVNHYNMGRAAWEVLEGLGYGQCCTTDVLRGYAVGEVNYACFRVDAEYHALHHAHKGVFEPEISGECYQFIAVSFP